MEVKVLGGVSKISEFEKALGQYIIYKLFIEEMRMGRALYLAVSDEIFETFFKRISIQFIVKSQNLKIFVFDPEKEEIVQWIN